MTTNSATAILADFVSSLPYKLDDFQEEALSALAGERNVVVSAPTGAGKTVIAEAAGQLALEKGIKLFYTTPIKALSNQKFRDFSARWGDENVGLLTGDVAINGEAPIVIMTTEVLRNMLYAQSHTLENLGYVVMDEVHYLGDEFRGPVWEEVILNLAQGVRLVALSATIGNTGEFTDWLNAVLGPTDLIETDFRPVPLETNIIIGSTIYRLADSSGKDLNKSLVKRVDKLLHKPDTEPRFPNRLAIIDALQAEDLLPAIDFIFSRAGCDAALAQCDRSHIILTTKAERDEIFRIVDEETSQLSEEDKATLRVSSWRKSLGRGCAAHHAGMLPLFRQTVEKLFAAGLLKIVFATSTLALGINMPARAVVLEKLTKFNGAVHTELTSSQYSQLTGRAGRRGLDDIGHAVIYYTRSLDLDDVWALHQADPEPLVSSFRVGYNMVVNMLASHNFKEARTLLYQSFGQFQRDRSIVVQQRELNDIEQQLASLDESLPEGMAHFLDLVAELNYVTKKWEKTKKATRQSPSKKAFNKLHRGDIVCLTSKKLGNKHKPVLGVLLDNPHRGEVIAVTSNWDGAIGAHDIWGSGTPLGFVNLKDTRPGSAKALRKARLGLERSNIKIPEGAKNRQRTRPPGRLKKLRHELRAHPLHGQLQSHDIARLNKQRSALVRRRNQLREAIDTATSTLGKDFSTICTLLQKTGYVNDEYQLTSSGDLLRSIYAEADLICSEAVREHVYDCLDPAELAAAISALTGESRQENARAWPAIPSERLDDALSEVRRIARDTTSLEYEHQLLLTRPLYAGFAPAVHQWACGAPLEHCLMVAKLSGLTTSPGDFVRHIRQTIDLLSQLAQLHDPEYQELVESAREARRALTRGIVAESL